MMGRIAAILFPRSGGAYGCRQVFSAPGKAAKLIRNLCVAAELENGRRRFSRNRQNRNLKSLQLGRECLDRGGALRLGKHQRIGRSEEHTSELQSLMRISYAVFCLKKKTRTKR